MQLGTMLKTAFKIYGRSLFIFYALATQIHLKFDYIKPQEAHVTAVNSLVWPLVIGSQREQGLCVKARERQTSNQKEKITLSLFESETLKLAEVALQK